MVIYEKRACLNPNLWYSYTFDICVNIIYGEPGYMKSWNEEGKFNYFYNAIYEIKCKNMGK